MGNSSPISASNRRTCATQSGGLTEGDEALRGFIDYAFGVLAMNRIEADIDPRNARSAKSLERLGFVKEGFLRERWIVAGEVSDTALYGLLRRDWAGTRG